MLSMEQELLKEQINVSRETMDRMSIYEQLVRKWNPAINLVAKSSLEDLWHRHFLDSIHLFDFAAPTSGLWLDLGSGGGFPGMIVAIIAKEKAPELRVTCIESDIRKCEFLRTVARNTEVPMGVMSRRIEDTPPQRANFLSARALSGLPKLLEHAERHLDPDGTAMFLKGQAWKDEVEEARNIWSFDIETRASLTQSGSALLKLRNIVRA